MWLVCSTEATGLHSEGEGRAAGPVAPLLATGRASAAGVALLPLLLKWACDVRLPWASPPAVGAVRRVVMVFRFFSKKKLHSSHLLEM